MTETASLNPSFTDAEFAEFLREQGFWVTDALFADVAEGNEGDADAA